MRAEGLEPPRSLDHEDLNLARLPVPPRPLAHGAIDPTKVYGVKSAMADIVVHPNRDKAESKATRALVILLLVASAVLILVVTVGGWSLLQGAQIISFALAVIYLVMAFFVVRWNRGVLPVAAALAVLLAVIAAVAGRPGSIATRPASRARRWRPRCLACCGLARAGSAAPGGLRHARLPATVERRGGGRARRGERSLRRPEPPGPAGLSGRAHPVRLSHACPGGGIGIRDRTQNPLPLRACGFESHPGHLPPPAGASAPSRCG